MKTDPGIITAPIRMVHTLPMNTTAAEIVIPAERGMVCSRKQPT
jgi:hypothetical protein